VWLVQVLAIISILATSNCDHFHSGYKQFRSFPFWLQAIAIISILATSNCDHVHSVASLIWRIVHLAVVIACAHVLGTAALSAWPGALVPWPCHPPLLSPAFTLSLLLLLLLLSPLESSPQILP